MSLKQKSGCFGKLLGWLNGKRRRNAQQSGSAESGMHYLNPILDTLAEDTLYHFGLSSKDRSFEKEFGDVKFVCCGGSSSRIKMYAEKFAKLCNLECLGDLSKSDRFCLYKTGSVLWANHGMGTPSLSIMLNEIIKLLHYAKVQKATFIRLGTSGGIGVTPGTVIVSSGAMNSQFREEYVLDICGKPRRFPCPMDQMVASQLHSTAESLDYGVVFGKTFCANDFYEGQMRLDGCFAVGSQVEKMQFLEKLSNLGVKNIEMESICLAAMVSRAGHRAGIICVALLNRMEGDQVRVPHETYISYEMRPFHVVLHYVAHQLGYGVEDGDHPYLKANTVIPAKSSDESSGTDDEQQSLSLGDAETDRISDTDAKALI